MAKDDSGFAEIEEYTKKLTQNPESLVFVPLAESYRKSGMLDEAIETSLKGLQVHPSYMSARIVLGRAYMDKELYEDAANEFRKVAAADANNIMAHSLLGQIYMKQGKYSSAIEEYQKVLSLNPDDANAQQMLQQALEQAKKTGQTRPAGVPDTKNELSQAEALTKQGDIENAIKIYRLILEADPENLVVRQRLKDLELRKAQASTERKTPERAKAETASSSHRDNDKITSDDILSVMKDTIPKAPEKNKEEEKGEKKKEEKKEEKREEKKTAPAKEPKPEVKAPPAAETRSLVGPEIEVTLGKLNQTPGIVGSLLIDEKGKVLHSTFKQPGNLQEMAQTTAVILQKTEKAVSAMDYGRQVRQILVTGQTGQIFFTKLGNRILLVQADENINIGKLRLALNEVNKVLR